MTLFPDGTKERIHGHNYNVGVAVRWAGEQGFVDLSCLKAALASLCGELREHLLMPSLAERVTVVRCDGQSTEMLVCGKRYVIPTEDVLWLPIGNVVVEELAEYLWRRMDEALGDRLVAASVGTMEVTVTEACGQGARYESSLRER